FRSSVEIKATQTIYKFVCGPLDLQLTFTSPLLMDDLNLLSRPVSYISFKMNSNDGAVHKSRIYFGASADLAVNSSNEEVKARQYQTADLSVLKAGTLH